MNLAALRRVRDAGSPPGPDLHEHRVGRSDHGPRSDLDRRNQYPRTFGQASLLPTATRPAASPAGPWPCSIPDSR